MLIDGIGIGGYRSFGADLQKIGPLAKVNLIVGQNNSGKSNILRFVHEHYRSTVPRAARGRQGELGFHPLDQHLPQPCPLRFAVGIPRDHAAFTWADELLKAQRLDHHLNNIIDCFAEDDGLSWFRFIAPSIDAGGWEVDQEWIEKMVDERGDSSFLQTTSRVLLPQYSGDPKANVAGLVRALCSAIPALSPVAFVPAIRQIGKNAITDGDYTGQDIIERLADLQHPSIQEQEKRERFQAITEFVQTVLDEPNAEIEIPVQHDTVHVHLGQHRLPLEHLGTGIHEVTMLASWATILTDHVLCIEEPELHLHPLLQRKLIQYLADRTTNQYLISTHSAHILEHPEAVIFHVRWDGSQSLVHQAVTSADRVGVCGDLGYRAADLLQANAVIWVEGPSDRIYIRHWLETVDPSLTEGIHYSLMFYGGRLLAHLSADDPEVQDFISLRRINQYLTIVMDSDKSSPSARLNKTKTRVQTEMNEGPGFAWVTKGREIENYVAPNLLLEVIQELYGDSAELEATGQYDQVLAYRSGKKAADSPADKVKVARAVASRPVDLAMLDLRTNVKRLVQFVRDANGLKQTAVDQH